MTEGDAARDARREGYQASLAGQPYSSNPYRDSSLLLCQAWNRGFEQGEVDQAEGEHFRPRSV